MATIKQLEHKGEPILPVTNENAVLDDNGITLKEKIDNVNTELSDRYTKEEINTINQETSDKITNLENELTSLENMFNEVVNKAMFEVTDDDIQDIINMVGE